MRIAVIGLGYWGPNIVRNLVALGQEVYVYDKEMDKITSVLELHKECIPLRSLDEVWGNQSIEAVVLAVPLPAHCDLILRSLRCGKHVFVEKPLCFSTKEADAIGQTLEGTILMVGHITQFSKGIQRIATAIHERDIGDIRRLSFARTHLGPIYGRTDVLSEVAAHDISIVTSFVSKPPHSVQAWGIELLHRGSPDAAHLVLQWFNGPIAQIDVQWSSVIRRREIEIDGSDGTLLFRAHGQQEELFLYRHKEAYDVLKQEIRWRLAKDLVEQKELIIEPHEPLREELSHFLDCIRTRNNPTTDFHFGRTVVSILEASRLSMERNGATVDVWL
jgi:UDP-2-acetamido-3-amino-2,3-dideoxy-glucuronate N-acetyltransferase